MIKRLFILASALFCATTLIAQNQVSVSSGYTVQTVPNVQLADARRFTSNPDGILSAATEAEINRMCGDLRQKQLAEVVVLVLERVEESDLDMFAHKVLNRWGVGQKGKDNGLVISVVRSQRDIQFETGYGLEGVLPDAICKRIQTVYMVDPLHAGNFDKGVLDGVKAVYNVLTDNQAELTALRAADNGGTKGADLGLLGLLAPLFIIFMAILIIIAARNKRGGGRNGRNGYDDDDLPGGPGAGRFGGPDAGSIIGGILGGLLGGGLGGGFGGGGFGGGGFGGGGFGGGRSGGGGARSGF